jgi:hypothetical protein
MTSTQLTGLLNNFLIFVFNFNDFLFSSYSCCCITLSGISYQKLYLGTISLCEGCTASRKLI